MHPWGLFPSRRDGNPYCAFAQSYRDNAQNRAKDPSQQWACAAPPRCLNVLCRGKSNDLSHLRSAAIPLPVVQGRLRHRRISGGHPPSRLALVSWSLFNCRYHEGAAASRPIASRCPSRRHGDTQFLSLATCTGIARAPDLAGLLHRIDVAIAPRASSLSSVPTASALFSVICARPRRMPLRFPGHEKKAEHGPNN